MKKIPLRKCTGCGEMKPKRELIRVVRAPDQKDESGNVICEGAVNRGNGVGGTNHQGL